MLRMRPRPHSACRGDHPGTLTLLTWPDVLVRIAEPGPASFIQVGSDAKIQRRCHLIVTFLLERVHEKPVELRGFEPLTSCMPYRPGQSPDEARRRPACRLPAMTVAGCGLVSPSAWRRWLPTWLPANPLARLTSRESDTRPIRQPHRPVPDAARDPYPAHGTERGAPGDQRTRPDTGDHAECGRSAPAGRDAAPRVTPRPRLRTCSPDRNGPARPAVP